MIRRDAGTDWLLITQHDHAAVAAHLATHVGGRHFAPLGSGAALAAIAHHDDGWHSQDDLAPALDARGRPLHVFDAPGHIALPTWAASADAATTVAGPYAGLLVSLHSLSLSIRAATGPSPWTLSDPHVLFALNKFQHREIERQEELRRAAGLRTDVPLHHGLAEPGTSAADDRLVYHFRLLQAMDLLSLCLCCTQPPEAETDDVLPGPGTTPKRLRAARDAEGFVRVRPWPFDVARIELSIRCRRLSASPFSTVDAFRIAYAAAPWDLIPATLRP